MRTLCLPLMALLCGLLTIGCPSSGDETGGGNEGGNGTGGTGGVDGACGAGKSCTFENDACYDFCISLCGSEDNTEVGFCALDEACSCVCSEGDCDRTGCTFIDCIPSPTADDFCDDQGLSLCGSAPRDALCLATGAESGFCNIVCDFGTVTCVPEP